jgi:hypothetical protein
MKTKTMTQCRLERGSAVQVSWIPSEFAEPARVIKLWEDRNGGYWSENWVVARVYDTLPAKVIADRERDFKTHRRATDV